MQQTANNLSLSLKPEQGTAVMMPKGYSNDLRAESLEQISWQHLGNGLKKHVANFSDVLYYNTIWNVSKFEPLDSGV